MKIKQFIFYTMLGITFAGCGFLFGYIFSSMYSDKHTPPIAQSSFPQQIANAEPVSPPPDTPIITVSPTLQTELHYYIVQNDNNLLCIYEINGNEKNVIKTFPINLNILPNTDKSLLCEGITTDNINSAYEIAENFTS